MSTQLQVGDGVRRKDGSDAHVSGRVGNILKINGDRATVYWLRDSRMEVFSNSSGGLGVRTQVKLSELIRLDQPVSEGRAKEDWNDKVDKGLVGYKKKL